MIKRLEVYGPARDKFLMEKFGPNCGNIISSLYEPLMALYNDYQGAFWVYHTLSNGGFFISPQYYEPLKICRGSMTMEISPEAIGIFLTLKSIESVAFEHNNWSLIKGLYQLRAYAYQQKEAKLIFNLLDPNF